MVYGDLGEAIDDALLGGAGSGGLGAGDAVGALLWGVALWFVTPLQLLLLFLGKIETERPSDLLITAIGRAAGLDVDAIDYEAPGWTRTAAAALCLAGGAGIAAGLALTLGDATWSVSSGLGTLISAGVFEAGRPRRVRGAEALALEEQWQDFARFADRRLRRAGRCHESEVFAAFRREHARYRSPDVVDDATLRTMVANWHPGVDRSKNGFYRNVSLLPPGSGSASASAAQSAAASVTASAVEVSVSEEEGGAADEQPQGAAAAAATRAPE